MFTDYGPDSFPIFFFRYLWETIKVEMVKLMGEVHDGIARLGKLNYANITLILCFV